MNHIGSIIKEYRDMLGMNRTELANNICTEKYIYLIEKGERTPSADMINMIGERLGIDLFEYYKYLGCYNPILVRDAILHFNECRRKGDFYEIEKITKTISQFEDFKLIPWIYEIELNRISCNIFNRRNYNVAIDEMNINLKKMDSKYINSYYAANLNTLLSICYQLTNNYGHAQIAISNAEDILQNKQGIDKYKQIITLVKVSSMTLTYIFGDFDLVIKKGKALLQYLHSFSSYLSIYYAYFYIAFSYYKLENVEEASIYYKKGINCLLVEEKQLDVYYLYEKDVFKELFHLSNMNQCTVKEFMEKYHLMK